MRPPWPLLLLTLLQGMAGGMAVTAVLLPSPLPTAVVDGMLGIALIGAVASIFHMHRLQAALYVLRRLSTSWLSREVLTTGLFVAAIAVWTLIANIVGHTPEVVPSLTALLGVTAMFVTAMVYASIPAMRSWHGPLTVVAMMSTGLVSGAMVLDAVLTSIRAPVPLHTLGGILVGSSLCLTGFKALQARHFRTARDGNHAETGTGLPFGPYRLQDTGTTRPPYRTQTQVSAPMAPATRQILYLGQWLFLSLIPAGSFFWALSAPRAALFGAAAMVAGSFFERWLFFADATHSSRVWFDDQPKKVSRVAAGRSST